MADYQISFGMSDGSTIKSNTFSIEGIDVNDINSLSFDFDEIEGMSNKISYTKDGKSASINSSNKISVPVTVNISYLLYCEHSGDFLHDIYIKVDIHGEIKQPNMTPDEVKEMLDKYIHETGLTNDYFRTLFEAFDGLTISAIGYRREEGSDNILHLYLLNPNEYTFFDVGYELPDAGIDLDIMELLGFYTFYCDNSISVT